MVFHVWGHPQQPHVFVWFMPLHGLIPAAGRMKNGALQTVQKDASCIIHRNVSLEQLLLLEAGAVAAAGGRPE